MSSPVTSQAATVQIARINVERMLVPIRGTSPLIVHKFSEKAKRQMLDAQQGRKTPKERRDPEADYQAGAEATPLKRPVAVEDLAAALTFILTARSLTGQNLVVDAGAGLTRRDRDLEFA